MPLAKFPDFSRYLSEKNGGLKPGWVVDGSPVALSSPHIVSQVPANILDAFFLACVLPSPSLQGFLTPA